MTTHPVGSPWDLHPLGRSVTDVSQVSIFSSIYNFDAHPPLYYLLLKGWLWLTWRWQPHPPPEWLLRFPSWACSVGALWLTYCLAKRWLGAGPAQWVLAVLAGLQASVWMTQEVRMYPLLSLLVIGGVLGAVRWWQDGSVPGLAWWAACSVLGFYTHYLGALAPVAVVLWALWSQRGSRWKGFVIAGAAVLALCLPWWPVVHYQMTAGHGPPNLSLSEGGWGWMMAPHTWMTLMCGFSLPPEIYQSGQWWILFAVGAVALVLGFWCLWRANRNGAILAALALGLPMGALMAAQRLTHNLSLYQDRYFVYLAPFAAVALGAACARWWGDRRGRIGAAALVLFLLGCNLLASTDWYFFPQFQRQRWREAVERLAPELSRGDLVLLQNSFNDYVFRYYLDRAALPPGTTISMDYPGPEAVASGALAAAVRPFHRVWLISANAWQMDPKQTVLHWLAAHGTLDVDRSWKFSGPSSQLDILVLQIKMSGGPPPAVTR